MAYILLNDDIIRHILLHITNYDILISLKYVSTQFKNIIDTHIAPTIFELMENKKLCDNCNCNNFNNTNIMAKIINNMLAKSEILVDNMIKCMCDTKYLQGKRILCIYIVPDGKKFIMAIVWTSKYIKLSSIYYNSTIIEKISLSSDGKKLFIIYNKPYI
jgi:hypothetical protein